MLVYRFPNLFGKWCRPNYNSAVATFCNNIANDLPIQVNDRSVQLELLYIDDLVDEMMLALEGREHRCEFDGIDTVKLCLDVFAPMVATIKVFKENMLLAAQKGFINATDLADYLVKKGLPFRSAYKISGSIVAKCIQEGKVLETLTLQEYKQFSDLFEEDLYQEISLTTCVEKRISYGGTSFSSVEKQIEYVKGKING